MSENLPIDYRDYPTAYVGQPKRHPSQEFGDFPDRSKPDAPARRENAEDALDADRPAGASTTPVSDTPKKTIVWKARGHK